VGTMYCVVCRTEEVAAKRIEAGFITCLRCGEADAKKVKWCVTITSHKGAYGVVRDREMLKCLNKYQPI
jgi:hypothetical protein